MRPQALPSQALPSKRTTDIRRTMTNYCRCTSLNSVMSWIQITQSDLLSAMLYCLLMQSRRPRHREPLNPSAEVTEPFNKVNACVLELGIVDAFTWVMTTFANVLLQDGFRYMLAEPDPYRPNRYRVARSGAGVRLSNHDRGEWPCY